MHGHLCRYQQSVLSSCWLCRGVTMTYSFFAAHSMLRPRIGFLASCNITDANSINGNSNKAHQTPVVTTYYVASVAKGAPFASFPMIGNSFMFRKNRDKLARQLSSNQSPISEVMSVQWVSNSPYSDPWLHDFRDLVSIVSAEFSIKGHIILDSMAEFYLAYPHAKRVTQRWEER